MESRYNREGFTLIELLVVIAIIAILAAILFPVFISAKGKAKQTTCLSNMKQLGAAHMQYAQDFNETLPRIQDWDWQSLQKVVRYPAGGKERITWMYSIYRYVRNVNTFNCPSARTHWKGDSNILALNYGYNMNLNPRNASNTWWVDARLSRIVSPSATVMLTDGHCHEVQRCNIDDWAPEVIDARHNKGANFAFCDGHTRWLTVTFDSNGDAIGPGRHQGVFWTMDKSGIPNNEKDPL